MASSNVPNILAPRPVRAKHSPVRAALRAESNALWRRSFDLEKASGQDRFACSTKAKWSSFDALPPAECSVPCEEPKNSRRRAEEVAAEEIQGIFACSPTTRTSVLSSVDSTGWERSLATHDRRRPDSIDECKSSGSATDVHGAAKDTFPASAYEPSNAAFALRLSVDLNEDEAKSSSTTTTSNEEEPYFFLCSSPPARCNNPQCRDVSFASSAPVGVELNLLSVSPGL